MKTSKFGPTVMAYVALGSNQGDSRQILVDAMERLQAIAAAPILKSSLWQSTPVDCPPDSPRFVNAAVGLVPVAGETPDSLLAKLQALEQAFGRQPKQVLNEARPLDLDLIAFGAKTCTRPELTLPHPRAQVRRFVLQPLAEIAPDLVLPGQRLSVLDLLVGLPPGETVSWISSPR